MSVTLSLIRVCVTMKSQSSIALRNGGRMKEHEEKADRENLGTSCLAVSLNEILYGNY